MISAIGKDLLTFRFWRHFSVHTFAGVGVWAFVLGLIDVIFPDAISERATPITLLVIFASIGYGLFRAWPRPIQESYSNFSIRLVSGDLFANDQAHLVIGMSDTFDTAIPDIISRRSVLGQFLDRVFAGNVPDLDRQLTAALAGVSSVGTVQKPGKTERYPLGTVATLQAHERRFFCLAYTEMSDQNEAFATIDGIWLSLQNLWTEVRTRCNGGTVYMPVIGGGQARVTPAPFPPQDSIRLILLSFIFACRHQKVCDELVVVVHPDAYDRLDRLELQAFLTSLKGS